MKRMLAVALAVLGVTACGGPDSSEDHLSQTTKAKLETAEVKPGSGTEARRGRRVSVHYTGWLVPSDQGAAARTQVRQLPRPEPTLRLHPWRRRSDPGLGRRRPGHEGRRGAHARHSREPGLPAGRQPAGHSAECHTGVRGGAGGGQVGYGLQATGRPHPWPESARAGLVSSSCRTSESEKPFARMAGMKSVKRASYPRNFSGPPPGSPTRYHRRRVKISRRLR